MSFKVVHLDSGKQIASKVKYANTPFSRIRGLMFTKELKDMDALLIEPCNSIHNCFVYFSLDVVFMDRDNKVVKILRNFKPWRFSWIYLRARKVLEMPAGELDEDVKEGDILEVRGV